MHSRIGIIPRVGQTPSKIPLHQLDYATPGLNRRMIVKFAEYGLPEQAELDASVLRREGIPAQVFGAHAGSLGFFYQGFNSVELHVRCEDVERATQTLARLKSEDLEPADDSPDVTPAVDDFGQPLVIAAAFDNVRALRDAQAILASAHISSVLPVLAPRGDRPPGIGKRFVLRVADPDAERARHLLCDDADDRAEPRCPRCASWRTYSIVPFWKSLAAMFHLTDKPRKEVECLACHHTGPEAEFRPDGPLSQ